MTEPIIYLDHAATSPVPPSIAEQLVRDFAELGWNTGTRYQLGLTAKKALEDCRLQIARAMGCAPEAIIFTSGGTESNNIALHACCSRTPQGGVLWSSATTHPSISGPVGQLGPAWQVHPMPRLPSGAVDVAGLAALPSPDVVVLEWVNNEVGFIQPVAEIAAAAATTGNPAACIVVDGAQGFGKIPPPDMTPLTAFSFSGHKVGAPVGIGVMMIKPHIKVAPLYLGGGQEQGWRPGTVPLPLIRALCGALALASGRKPPPFEFAAFDGGDVPTPVRDAATRYSPYITMLDLAPVEGEVLQHHLEESGIFLGVGSACSASKKGLSPIHKALHMDAKRSRCTLRWSSCPGQDANELNRAWRQLVLQWRELKRFF